MIPSMFSLPKYYFFLQYGDDHNSNWKTVPEAVPNEDNPRVRGISLESTAAFCRRWNWKCVKLKCPEIKTVAWAAINWKLKSLARSASPSNQDRLIEVRLGTFGEELNSSSQILPRVKGHYYPFCQFCGVTSVDWGMEQKLGSLFDYQLNIYELRVAAGVTGFINAWRRLFHWGSWQLPFVPIGFVRNGRASHAFLLKSVFVPRVWIT